jgi:hypothetical protein
MTTGIPPIRALSARCDARFDSIELAAVEVLGVPFESGG